MVSLERPLLLVQHLKYQLGNCFSCPGAPTNLGTVGEKWGRESGFSDEYSCRMDTWDEVPSEMYGAVLRKEYKKTPGFETQMVKKLETQEMPSVYMD